MTKKVTTHVIGSIVLGLAFGFFIANWSIARTSAKVDEMAAAPSAIEGDKAQTKLSRTETGLGLMLAAAHQAGGQEDKPVEQTAKNIKVLNGLPSSKLFPVMNFFSDSLGVRCAYCHVQLGPEKIDFVSDTKPEKETAREMIKMVLAVNKDNFNNNPAITCYTCHRGQARVVGLPPFPLPSRESFAAPPAEHNASTLPTPDQLFDKYLQAIGGKAAFDKLKTRVWKGTFITGNGISMPYEVRQAAPDKFLSILTTPKQGVFETGYNGTSGWMQNARGTRSFGASDLGQFKRLSSFFGGVNLKEQYTKPRVVGTDKIGDREAYVMRAVSVTGNNERLYFDTQTGLLLRVLSVERTMLVPIPEQIDFSDYREVDGVKLPFTIQVYNIDPSNGATRKFTEVKHNVPVDDARFNQPPAPVDKPKTGGAQP